MYCALRYCSLTVADGFFFCIISRYSFCTFFFFNDTATTEIYTLSLHDALPISVGDEALDLVHVETLVDPVDEQGLGRVGLRADLAVLALVDLVGRDDQREDAERRLGERLRPSRTPRAHAHVGVHVELLPSRNGHDNEGREAGAVGGWPETRRDPAAFRLSLFIPSGAASPGRSVAGLSQGTPRLRSASRHSLQVAESALEDGENRGARGLGP